MTFLKIILLNYCKQLTELLLLRLFSLVTFRFGVNTILHLHFVVMFTEKPLIGHLMAYSAFDMFFYKEANIY